MKAIPTQNPRGRLAPLRAGARNDARSRYECTAVLERRQGQKVHRGLRREGHQGRLIGLHHTDTEREFAYDRKSSIGRLDKGLDEAKARGWTVVSMKDEKAFSRPKRNELLSDYA